MLNLLILIVYVSAQTVYDTPGSFSGIVPNNICQVELTARGGKGGNFFGYGTGGTSGIVSAKFSVTSGLAYRGVVANEGKFFTGGGSSGFVLNEELLVLGGGGGGCGLYNNGTFIVYDGGAGNNSGMGGSPNGTMGINQGDGGSGGGIYGGSGGKNGNGGNASYDFHSGGGGGGVNSDGGFWNNFSYLLRGRMPNTNGSAAAACGTDYFFSGGEGYTSGGCGFTGDLTISVGGGGGGYSGGGGGNFSSGGAGGGGSNYINPARLLSITTNNAYDGNERNGSMIINWIPCRNYDNSAVSFDYNTYNVSNVNVLNVSGNIKDSTLRPNVTLVTNITILNNLTVTKSSNIVGNTIYFRIIIENTGNTPIFNVSANDSDPFFNKTICIPPLPTNLTAGTNSICEYSHTFY